jgi:hypothetical protein
MNERIRELATEVGMSVEYLESTKQIVLIERFAELIVRECIEQLRYTVLNTQELRRDKSTDYQVGWEDGMFDAKEMIKEHFGVEL